MIYQTSVSDDKDDAPCHFAGIISDIYIFFCNGRLQNIWPLHCMIPNHSWDKVLHCIYGMSTIEHTFSFPRMLHRSETHFVMCYLFLLLWKVVVSSEGMWSLFLDLKPKSLVTECILVGFDIHNSEMYINTQSTNKALDLACLFFFFEVFGVSKEIISFVFPSFNQSDIFITDVWWCDTDVGLIPLYEKKVIWHFVKPKMLESVHKIMSIMWC